MTKPFALPRRLRDECIAVFGIALLTLIAAGSAHAQRQATILHVNSYHEGFEWSDRLARGLNGRLITEAVSLNTVYLDAYRRPRSVDILSQARKVKTIIEELKPDIVITSDDAAFRFIVDQHLNLTSLPVIFSGVNHQVPKAKYPSDNVTGITETAHIKTLVDLLSRHTEGRRIGLLARDRLSALGSINYYRTSLGRDLDRVYLSASTEEWRQHYIQLQNEVDMLILESPVPKLDGEPDQLQQFVMEHTRIPVGATVDWLAPFSLVTVAKSPEEQGWWAAQTAVAVLNGIRPADVPVATNKEARLVINIKLAERLGFRFSQAVIEIAETAN